jgi:predicted DNA-binding transcriptional regulator AlpA
MSKPKRFLSKKEVRDKVKLSYAEVARREKAGKFPMRLRLGNYPNSRAVYVEEDIDAWMDEQIAARDASASG